MSQHFATATRRSSLYQTWRWKQERKAHLTKEPYCRTCLRDNKRTLATTVDHEPPHRGDAAAFWDRSRYVSLCSRHHNIKTGHETQMRRDNRRPAEQHPGLVKA